MLYGQFIVTTETVNAFMRLTFCGLRYYLYINYYNKHNEEAVQSMLADIFYHTAGEPEKDPQDEKPISLDSASKKDNHNPLEWWKLNSLRYEVLSCLATNIYAYKPSVYPLKGYLVAQET